MNRITALDDDELEEFLMDPETKNISGQIFGPDCDLLAHSNGKIVRLFDLYGWNEYYNHDELTSFIAIDGKIKRIGDIYRLNAIEEIEVDED